MKHTFRSKRLLALLVVLVMVISMFPAHAFAAENTLVGSPELVKLGSDAAAQRVNDFNMGWKFYLGDNSAASKQNFDDSAWDNVNLPHDFSIIQNFTSSGEAESGFLPGGTGWYRKSFVIGEEAAGKTFLLNFDGVYSDAYVYVNGTFVGEHHYGYTSFAFDISDYLICDGATQNVVAVKAVNNVPSSRWYSGSGIYRDVTLYALESVHVDLHGVTVTTPFIDEGDGTAVISVDLVNDANTIANATVRTTVYFCGQEVATAEQAVTIPGGSKGNVELEAVVAEPALWSIEDPNQYMVLTEVLVNGSLMDECSVDFGFRWTEWKSSGFYLNGKAVKLNGVCMHHDQGGLGSAAYYDAMYRQLSIMKDMGANAIRTAHNPADEQYIQICNEIGLLVIEETFDGLVDPKNGNSNDFSKYFEKTASAGLYGYTEGMTNAEYVARSVVKRDKNAPSIIAWSFGNEIQEGTYWNNVGRYDDICADYISWVNDEDGTRIVTSGDNNRGGDNRLVDVLNTIINAGGVVGFNYANSASQLADLARRFGGSKGVIIASETASHTNSRGQYRNQNNNSNSDGKYHLTSYDTSAVGWGITAHDSIYNTYQYDNVAGEFVWTGFDYIGEPTPWNGTGTGDNYRGAIPNSSYFGIVETTGFPKDSFYLYRAQWNKDETTVHLVTAWDNNNMYTDYSGKTPVWVYTNAAKVELYLNDALIGTTVRKDNTSAAGHTYYTYTATSNNASVCSAASNYNADALYSIFNVAYTAGTLKAVAYDANGNELDTYTVTTPGAAAKVVATANRTEIDANNSDLVYVEIDVTDAEGNLVTTASNNLTFTVEGPAEIAGVDNGDQATVRKYQNNTVLTDRQNANINAYAGKALVILRATDESGEIKLTISADGLTGQTVTVNAVSDGVSGDEGLVSYEMIRDYTVMAGSAPELDTAITGYLADDTAVSGTIEWRAISEELYAQAGDYTITGIATFDGYGEIKVTARLHVIPNVVALRNVSAATMEGVAPVLPASVAGVLADGTLAGEFQVTWNEVDASEFANVGDVVVVTGTATVFAEETLDVTCTVRVAEAVNTESTNVAPMAETVSQDVPAGYESDNLMSINNGVTKPGDNTSERWTNWNYRTYKDNATLTLFWATAQMVNSVNIYYYYDNCCAYPEEIEFSYSLNGQEYEVIGHSAEQIETFNLGDMWTYTFDQPINPVGLKVKVTQQDGTSGNHCVGITELEVMTYAATLETQSGAQLSNIFVDGTAIEGFDPATFSYEIADGVITAEAEENVGITILPKHKGYVRILTVSEDGTAAEVYELAIAGEVCYHENTEVIPGVPASCTKPGLSDGEKCTDCGEIVKAQEEIPALGHTEETIPGTPATFDNEGTSDGVKCSVCGMILVQPETVPALDYNEGIVPVEVLTATAGSWQAGYANEGPADLVLDDDMGTMWHTDWNGCSVSDQWIQFELSEAYLVDGLRYKPRTGSINGVITKYEIQVSNDGVNFETVTSGDWENNSNWKVAEFDAQNVKFIRLQTVEAQTDSGKLFASAVEIRLTGVKAGEAPHEHSFGEWTVTTEPTCTEKGVETRTCECGETETREIPALGHTEQVIPAVAATCTETGLTEGKKCSVCGEILVAQEVVPALGHDFVNGKCSRCEETLTSKFEDVPAGAFYFDPVEWAVEKGITTGATATTFNPNGNCQRAQVVTFLWRAAGSPEPTSTTNPFNDVKETDFYYKAVLWAVEKGITNGLTADTFGPFALCNRAQVVTFLWRAMGSPASTAEVTFTDVVPGQFYSTAVAWAVENNITNGISATEFGVGGTCNRAQVVTFLYRTYNK